MTNKEIAIKLFDEMHSIECYMIGSCEMDKDKISIEQALDKAERRGMERAVDIVMEAQISDECDIVMVGSKFGDISIRHVIQNAIRKAAKELG